MYATSVPDLICTSSTSKSKQRRLRATKVRNKLWATASCQYVGGQPYVCPSWWQPEPELPQSFETGFDTFADLRFDYNVHADSSTPFANKEHDQNLFASNFMQEVSGILKSLGRLQDGLCAKLHHGIPLTVQLAGVETKDHVNDAPSFCDDGAEKVDHDNTEGDGFGFESKLDDVDNLPFLSEDIDMYLADSQSLHVELLSKLREAACFFNKNADSFDTVAQALELYWHLFDPAGVEQRQLDNADVEEEWQQLEENTLGHFFTYSRFSFWPLVKGVAPELHKRLVKFGIDHPQRPSAEQYSTHDLEKMYFNHDQRAFDWQNEYNDEDDETSELLELLRMLRQAARDR